MSQTTHLQKFSFVHWIKRCKNPHVLEVLVWSCRGLWRFLTGVLVPDHDGDRCTMSQTTYDPKFCFLHLIKKVQRTPMSSKSWSGVVKDSGGCWLRFWFLIMMERGLKCPKQPMFQILHWIKRCKVPLCPQSPDLELWMTLEVLDWGCGSWWWWGRVSNVPNDLFSKF